jgi:ribosomal protein L16/L10AE
LHNSFHEKRRGQLWIKIFPDKPITKAKGFMGKGKGAVEYWLPLLNRRIMFEVEEFLYQLQRGVTSCSSKAGKLNSCC